MSLELRLALRVSRLRNHVGLYQSRQSRHCRRFHRWEAVAEVDLYSPSTQWQQKSIFNGLAAGEHVIEIKVLPGKNPYSKGQYVDVDGLHVR